MNPNIEQASIEEITSFQDEKLRTVLNYLNTHSSYYRRLFKTEAINIQSIRGIRDLPLLPTTSKEQLQQFNWDFLCVPQDQIIDYSTTSGTLGTPVVFGLTDADLERLAYNEMISFQRVGIQKGDRVQIMTTLDRRFMAGLAYFLGLRKIGAGILRIGAGIPQMQWDSIQQFKPKFLVVVPSFLLKMIAYAEEHNIDYNNSSVKVAICIGENLRTAELKDNELAKRIQEKWNIALYSTYASTEMSSAFTECEAFNGGHQHPELIITEILDNDGNAVPDGQLGELVVTTLGIQAMPLLRYKTGDMVRRHAAPCTCGRNSYRIGPVEGRKQQMIKYKGTTLFPPAMFDVLASYEEIEHYQIEISSTAIGTDDIRVLISAKQENAALLKEIKDSFQAKLRVIPTVEFEREEILISKIYNPLNRKPTYLLDKREQ
ncbi:phenylacetate--CoA ligase family protein [Sphingobacterium sp. BIGb0165]|uniref:phenylacetate--CoA ligase family protein n=1 Tax=Sphingobacterium sp. BIGb0165 TaxID=2940615 RepID=UPI0021694FBF|nr:AMP-binding protein [Sphingobacterium sp. BIGb0165]MCS4225567.1 phenylacetate-CoA ligase [Sphingobacterium sp. BIGb0165]